MGGLLHAVSIFFWLTPVQSPTASAWRPVVLSTGGVNLALGTTLSLIGFVIVILFLLARLLQPIQVLGVLVFPAATLGITIAWLFPRGVLRYYSCEA